ncbi:MAG: hypothetical protein ACO1QB_14130 [Verrucomicrobiales bacterium]
MNFPGSDKSVFDKFKNFWSKMPLQIKIGLCLLILPFMLAQPYASTVRYLSSGQPHRPHIDEMHRDMHQNGFINLSFLVITAFIWSISGLFLLKPFISAPLHIAKFNPSPNLNVKIKNEWAHFFFILLVIAAVLLFIPVAWLFYILAESAWRASP